jgi:hypothetical protein
LARCTDCGAKGAILRHPSWTGSHVGFEPFLFDLDYLYARAARPANHVCRPAAVSKRHHQSRPPFVEHLLIADWTCRPAVLGPVGMKDHALDPPAFAQFSAIVSAPLAPPLITRSTRRLWSKPLSVDHSRSLSV